VPWLVIVLMPLGRRLRAELMGVGPHAKVPSNI